MKTCKECGYPLTEQEPSGWCTGCTSGEWWYGLMPEEDKMERTAIISGCGRYRYQLGRHWDRSRPCGAFLMLNPSTADAKKDDPTIRRCMGFAQQWGWGGLRVVNLMAWRASDPAALRRPGLNLIGDNARHLRAVLSVSPIVVCGWGSGWLATAETALGLYLPENGLSKLRALRVNKDGSPAHPLYLPSWERPSLWRPPWA